MYRVICAPDYYTNWSLGVVMIPGGSASGDGPRYHQAPSTRTRLGELFYPPPSLCEAHGLQTRDLVFRVHVQEALVFFFDTARDRLGNSEDPGTVTSAAPFQMARSLLSCRSSMISGAKSKFLGCVMGRPPLSTFILLFIWCKE
ncbi:hypothetical protein GDO81_004059 [Engystomops pustulosus]|uniref:Uncharacterized protein n=1 Tax=Engystomops pustulosus TaxID=76066 RepID=A0AAV6ZUQ3_ENGPU|nr:hypothetical protein GDO81_004059 [Engystomops pustulosus]